MNKATLAVALAVFAAGPAVVAASDKSDVMATVHQWVDGFNKGDLKGASAACADEVSIIDDIAPNEWHGNGACAKWADAYNAEAKKNGITDGVVTLGKPRHFDVSGDSAYMVVSATYTYKQGGKPMKMTGATVTMSLKKGSSGWRISGWSWADGVEAEVKGSS